jgi:mRNA-degrading endonuclease RelE of RelBE toxin-antitoxin system
MEQAPPLSLRDISPTRGESGARRLLHGSAHSEGRRLSRSPPLWGRCPAGQRGVSPKQSPWRYKVGDYRIICDIQDQKLIVLVVEIGHRSSVYR